MFLFIEALRWLPQTGVGEADWVLASSCPGKTGAAGLPVWKPWGQGRGEVPSVAAQLSSQSLEQHLSDVGTHRNSCRAWQGTASWAPSAVFLTQLVWDKVRDVVCPKRLAWCSRIRGGDPFWEPLLQSHGVAAAPHPSRTRRGGSGQRELFSRFMMYWWRITAGRGPPTGGCGLFAHLVRECGRVPVHPTRPWRDCLGANLRPWRPTSFSFLKDFSPKRSTLFSTFPSSSRRHHN